MGDMNGDGQNDLRDFDLFVTAYDGVHGAGSLAAALQANVPEPASLALASVMGLFLTCVRPTCRQGQDRNRASANRNGGQAKPLGSEWKGNSV